MIEVLPLQWVPANLIAGYNRVGREVVVTSKTPRHPELRHSFPRSNDAEAWVKGLNLLLRFHQTVGEE